MEESTATIITGILALVGTISAAIIGYWAVKSRRNPEGEGHIAEDEGHNAEESAPMWPKRRSQEALQRLLDRTSDTNLLLLWHVAEARRFAKATDLVDKTGRALDEVRYRMLELERQELVEQLVVAGAVSYKIDDSVVRTLGPNGKDVLKKLLT